jgi:quinol monooxygenase YgiN
LFTAGVFLPLQTTPDVAAHAVAYVDVLPSAKGAAVAAFKEYRENSRKDSGYLRMDAFEQIGRPGHLVILETWNNAAGL